MSHLDIATTQACEDRDFVEWHQGCPWCAVWVVRVDNAQVQAILQAVRGCVAAALLPRYERQAHITVAYRGLMDTAHRHTEFGVQQLQSDVRLLKQACPQPFDLQLQGVGSFTTVPYLAVNAAPALQVLHQLLVAGQQDSDWRYVPHVTLGHYAAEVPMADMQHALAQAAPSAGVWWQGVVDALWLARYRTHDIAGPLFFEGKFDFRTQCYSAAPDALWPQS